ncbi:MAG TPA: methyltransferase domain-containing protein [Candidatus Dormibacteraeota bacterium]|nr:methyltransferase domain-containing protein [Candidatus Dormibacteraeota bacterium]HEX2680888.1 methyltransferase domain-containing protein [Candidatus Dormibacteraeota bacterium]
MGARHSLVAVGLIINSMPDCCTPKGYRWIFSERSARTEAKRYRKRGLDGTSNSIVDFLKKRGVSGETVLEVGGGIGAIQIELLKAGATRATSIELTPTYEDVAVGLLAETGMTGRVDRRVMDFAEGEKLVEAADVVVMNRVVCCYPDMPRLVHAASRHARRVLVMTYPTKNPVFVALIGTANALLRLFRREFHIFLHSPEAILATSSEDGMSVALNDKGILWTTAALIR